MSSSLRRFLVAGMQRSGTTVTRSCLAGHPAVSIGVEVPESFFSAAITDRNARGETAAERTRSLLELFDHDAGRREDTRVVGLKVALTAVDGAARLTGCLQTHGVGIDLVIVRRRDLIAQLGSLRRAARVGVWHRRGAEAPKTEAAKLRIEPHELAEYVGQVVGCHRLLRRCAEGRRTLELDYEHEIATGDAWPRLFEFLGIEDLSPDWLEMRKISPPAADYIENYRELSELLPESLAEAERRPEPQPVKDPADSRVFLMRRAQMRRSTDPEAALADAVAALAAPPVWPAVTLEGPCATIAALLATIGDPKRAGEVRDRLTTMGPGDPHVTELLARIRAHLGAP